jgi:hypothetical protein
MMPVSSEVKNIKGWGADLDPAMRPAVPMEKPSNVTSLRGDVKDWQQPDVKIHQSIEQPSLTPTFGTTCPPRGLSGKLRDYAYSKSESEMQHWLTLMLADRVDVVEGLLDDLRKGHFPNYFKERGWTTEFTHVDRKRLYRNLLIAGAVVAGTAAVGLVATKRRRR